jgi:hypothetical protein
MNDGLLPYAMPIFSGLIGKALLFKDEETVARGAEDLHLEALVRSGDYFVTLASQLDALGQDINDYGTRAQIELIVSDLIYLQDNYAILKKEK